MTSIPTRKVTLYTDNIRYFTCFFETPGLILAPGVLCFKSFTYLCDLFLKWKGMLIKLYADNPNPKVVQKIANALREGGLIIYPTDTVYAIGCDIFHARAVEKICKLKKEDPRKANLSFICSDLAQVAEYAKLDTPTFKLLKRNLPGPFTFILNGNHNLPRLFKQKSTVGIRIPDNGIVDAIVRELGNPLMTMTLHDEADQIEYTTDPELIDERYGHSVDLVIDGGIGGIQLSTIVDCTQDEPVVVRQGKGTLYL